MTIRIMPREFKSYEEHQGRVSPLKPFIGKTGWLPLSLLTLESLDSSEDRLIREARRSTMIADLEGKCRVSETTKPLFQIRSSAS